MTKDEALKLAKDYLTDHQMGAHIITAIKHALAAPVQEPVGKVIASVPHLRSISVELLPEAPVPSEDSLIYTTPPAAQRQWVGLTDAEIDLLTSHTYFNGRPVSREYRVGIARAIEAKLKEKNNGM
jgi:hypothetical protein